MIWFTTLFLLALAIVLGAWFLHRYFAKATLETAMVRTGLGGRKVVIDGGCLALPIFHRLQKVSMAAIVVPVSRSGAHAVMCKDQLRADIAMEFELRVEPSAEGISTAAQSLGMRISRPGEATQELLTGILIDAIQNTAASRKLDDIHMDRTGFAQQVADAVSERVSRLGLQLVSASLVSADQAALTQHDENNAFQAQGMRRLAEMIAEQRKARVAVETATEIAIRESRLAQHQRQLEIQRTEQEADIAQREHFSKLEAEAEARSERARAEAGLISETARIDKERQAKEAQVASDEALRKSEMQAVLSLEEAKIDNDIQLARRRAEEAAEKAKEEEAKAQVIRKHSPKAACCAV